jgi:cysteine desulfurase family protein (TIGR01976 family)
MSGQQVPWDEQLCRRSFPALGQMDEGVARVYADAPGGTQVAGRVIARMREALVDHCANDGGVFRTSRETDAAMRRAHEAAASLLGARSSAEVLFALNTTSLLFHFSRMIARDWSPGDDIVLSRMDHDANVAPWLIAAEEKGVMVRWLEFDTTTFQYHYDHLPHLVGPRTRLIACNHASNFLGTINDVARIVAAGRTVGAVTVVDAVQSAPHLAIDVEAIGCDLLVTSPYKYFGPHAGLAFVRRELSDRLKPLKVRPSPDVMPFRHAPGTPSFEAQLGTMGAIEHIAWLGERFGGGDPKAPLRERLVRGYAAAISHETRLGRRFLGALRALPTIRIFGISDPDQVAGRVPTFSFRLEGKAPATVAQALAEENIYAWHGAFYAYEAAGVLGVRDTGGVVRVGFAHYNTVDEVDRIVSVLERLACVR